MRNTAIYTSVIFASRENLSEMLSHSDFELESIGEKPTVLFIVIQDEKKTYHSLVTTVSYTHLRLRAPHAGAGFAASGRSRDLLHESFQ